MSRGPLQRKAMRNMEEDREHAANTPSIEIGRAHV